MLTRYADIGYKFESISELVDLLKDNEDEAIYYESADKAVECMVLEPDCASRFWYYRNTDEDFISSLDLHYVGETSFWVRNPSWAIGKTETKVRDSYGRLAPIRNQARPMVVTAGKGTTFCVNLVEAPLIPDFTPTCKMKMAITGFTEEARVITAETEETFIPLGMFSGDGEVDKPRATMTSIVKEVVLQFNSYTGSFFWEVDVTCLGMEFTLVGSAATIKGIPKPGNRITGTFWLSGTVKEVLRK